MVSKSTQFSRGVKNRHELDLLIERAAEESPPVFADH